MPVLSIVPGLFLAGAMFLALGLLVSSLVRDQMVAALVSLVLGLVFIVAGFWRPDMDRPESALPAPVLLQRAAALRPRLHPRPGRYAGTLVLYGSVALFCLFLTVRSLESRRWR